MLPRQTRALFIPAKGTSNTAHFVCGHRFAVTRPAENDCAIAFSLRNRFCRRTNKSRVIDRCFAGGAEIFNLMPERDEQFLDFLFVAEASVIGTKRDFHFAFLPREAPPVDSVAGLSASSRLRPMERGDLLPEFLLG